MSIRPSETQRGRDWLTNFGAVEHPTAELLLNSLQVVGPAKVFHGLKLQIEALIPKLEGQTGVLIPVSSIEDIERTRERAGVTDAIGMSRPERHVAYGTFDPGGDIPATPGSEAAVGNLIRDLTGDRPGKEPGPWLHPATAVGTLRDRRCRLVVLVTDYMGSGQQASQFAATFTRNARLRSWRSFGWLRLVVVAYAASSAARDVIRSADSIDDSFIHSPASSFDDADWSTDERRAIEELCRRHTPHRQRKQALGHAASAGLFLTHTSVPNNLPFILRRNTAGWTPFLDGRTVPSDLAAELADYEMPSRDLAEVARRANQARLARAIESGRLRTPADKLVAVLALTAFSSQTPESLGHRLALPDEEIAQLLGFLESVGFVTRDLDITARGHRELRHARRLDRVATAHLTGKPDPYYPRALR